MMSIDNNATVLFVNVRVLSGNRKKRLKVFLLCKIKGGIYIFQETHSSEYVQKFWKMNLAAYAL